MIISPPQFSHRRICHFLNFAFLSAFVKIYYGESGSEKVELMDHSPVESVSPTSGEYQRATPEKKLSLSHILAVAAASGGGQGVPSPPNSWNDDRDDVVVPASSVPLYTRRLTLPDAIDITSLGGSESIATPTAATVVSETRRGCSHGHNIPVEEHAIRFHAHEDFRSVPSVVDAATARLARSETAASLAKRRASSSGSRRRRATIQTSAKDGDMGSFPGTHRRKRPNAGGDTVRTPRATTSPQPQEQQPHPPTQRSTDPGNSSGTSATPRVPHRSVSARNVSVLLPSSSSAVLSPSVALLGVGTYQDTKILAIRNAELRRELRELKDQNRRRLAEQASIVVATHDRHSDHKRVPLSSEDVAQLLDEVRRDAEVLGDAIEESSTRIETTEERIQNLQQQALKTQQGIAAERMARNSVQCVLQERRQAYESWKEIIHAERRRQEEAKMHDLLQKRMASASAGDRAVRNPSEVREERAALFELTQRLQGERDRLRDTSEELGRGIVDAKRRASELLYDDDAIEHRLHALQEYIQSARKVITERQLEEAGGPHPHEGGMVEDETQRHQTGERSLRFIPVSSSSSPMMAGRSMPQATSVREIDF